VTVNNEAFILRHNRQRHAAAFQWTSLQKTVTECGIWRKVPEESQKKRGGVLWRKYRDGMCLTNNFQQKIFLR